MHHRPATSPAILLVRPANIYAMRNYPPLAYMQLGSALEAAGFRPILLDSDGSPAFKDRLVDMARDALLVGLGAWTSEIADAIAIARAMKQGPAAAVPVVWGGWHPTLFPEQMEASPLVDYCITGDGDVAIVELAQALAAGAQPAGKMLRTPFPRLDDLPPTNYDLAPELERFITSPLGDKFQQYYGKPMRWLPYQTSRGCPYSCAFCINPTTGNRKYRAKDPLRSAREMAELVERHRLTHVKIIDDNLFVQRERVWTLLREMERLGVPYTWDAECRLDYIREDFVSDEMFRLMKKVGLVQLTFGIESGSLSTLRRMKKGLKVGPEYALRGVDACRRHDIAVRGSFILDIPGDTPDDIFETVKLIRSLRAYAKFACGVHTYRPYPKSPLCEDLLEKGLFYQPDSLEAWADEKSVRQYTDTAAKRTWQANFTLSSRVSFYESLESEFWLKPHQLSGHPWLARVNALFTRAARWRNRRQCYSLPWEKTVYPAFRDHCLKRMQALQRKTT